MTSAAFFVRGTHLASNVITSSSSPLGPASGRASGGRRLRSVLQNVFEHRWEATIFEANSANAVSANLTRSAPRREEAKGLTIILLKRIRLGGQRSCALLKITLRRQFLTRTIRYETSTSTDRAVCPESSD